MCDSMGDFFLDAYFDEEVVLRGIYNPQRRKSCYHKRNYDPLYYSRLAAVCQRCGARYNNLQRSVTETAKAARIDGWQIERNAKDYEWYCPKCRTAHDFEYTEPSGFGEWVYGEYDIPHCSECGAEVKEISPFCPQCGARMEDNDD